MPINELPFTIKEDYNCSKRLHWQTDLLLFDQEPVKKNEWITANNLLENGQRQAIFLADGELLNLYPIMVRKIEYENSERLLQSMPYLLLDDAWAKAIRKKSLAIAEQCYYYFINSSADFSIRNWQKKIIHYSEKQKRIPFPMFRLVDNWQAFFREKECIRFQSARGEDFWLPTKLTEELAYIIGVILGDGHLSDYAIYIVDQYENYIKKIARIMKQLFGGDILQYPHSQCNAFMLCQKGKWLVRLVNFLSDQPIAEKKYDAIREPLILKKDRTLRVRFWQGLMDTDGSYKSGITFCSASKIFVQEFCEFLQEHSIHHRFFKSRSKTGEGFGVRIAAKARKDFTRLIFGTQHPEKAEQLEELLQRTTGRIGRPRKYSQKNKTWEPLIVRALRKDRLIVEQNTHYFDFSLLPKVSVKVNETIKHILTDPKQRGLGKKLGISKQRLVHYKTGKIPIPLVLLEKALLTAPKAKKLMPFLEEENISVFHSSRTFAQLPLQPTKQLEEILSGAILRGGIITTAPNLEAIADFFGVEIRKKRITNAVLKKFIKTFMLLEAKNNRDQ